MNDPWAFKRPISLERVHRFLALLNPPAGSRIIDIGCGAGDAGLELTWSGYSVSWLKTDDTELAEEVPRSLVISCPVWTRWTDKPGRWGYGLCSGVIEHVAPESVMLVIDRLTDYCETGFLQIRNVEVPISQPFVWWLSRLQQIAKVTDARDLCGNSLFVVQRL